MRPRREDSMKCTHATIKKVVRTGFCDVGRYRYHECCGTIKRKPIKELNYLPAYGDGWEIVARWDYSNAEWRIEK